MLSWLSGKFGRKSKVEAKSRLQFVLVQDRTGLSGDEMGKFKKELISVIEKYFMIDDKSLDIEYQRQTDGTVLKINSPVLVRRNEKVSRKTLETTKIEKQDGQSGDKSDEKSQKAVSNSAESC